MATDQIKENSSFKTLAISIGTQDSEKILLKIIEGIILS